LGEDVWRYRIGTAAVPRLLRENADHPNRSETMTRLKRFAIALAAAATVTFAAVPTASAMPATCHGAMTWYSYYRSMGNIMYGLGDTQMALYYFGKADGIYEACVH
jgi:hypothetical protein